MGQGIYNWDLGQFNFLIVLLGIVDVILRGIGMWHAARNNQRNWFIALLVINSAGILPAVYLKFFQRQVKKA
ncbi:MAG: hypothetical protein HYW45_02075 [Candidatus Daviesbacteria bacterium]|nr:MAG: hypothetical protein HYW45_02075 [Candidatus Daviesbacteria bacterium]